MVWLPTPSAKSACIIGKRSDSRGQLCRRLGARVERAEVVFAYIADFVVAFEEMHGGLFLLRGEEAVLEEDDGGLVGREPALVKGEFSGAAVCVVGSAVAFGAA